MSCSSSIGTDYYNSCITEGSFPLPPILSSPPHCSSNLSVLTSPQIPHQQNRTGSSRTSHWSSNLAKTSLCTGARGKEHCTATEKDRFLITMGVSKMAPYSLYRAHYFWVPSFLITKSLGLSCWMTSIKTSVCELVIKSKQENQPSKQIYGNSNQPVCECVHVCVALPCWVWPTSVMKSMPQVKRGSFKQRLNQPSTAGVVPSTMLCPQTGLMNVVHSSRQLK